MKWELERYVRLYTRDTPEDIALGWEACALWHELLRKFDRAGVIELGRTGARGLAGLTRFPLEVVERCLPLLLEDGRVKMMGTAVICPNYIAANETPSSSTLRSQEWRGKQKDRGNAATILASSRRNVPGCNETSPDATGGDAAQREGTRGDSVPCRAVPSRAVPDTNAGSTGSEPPGSGQTPLEHSELQAAETRPAGDKPKDPPPTAPPSSLPLELSHPEPSPAERVWGVYVEGWRRVVKGSRPPRLDDKRRRLISARLRDFPLEDVIDAARGIWLDQWSTDDHAKRISPEILFRDAGHIEKFREIARHPELGRDTPARADPSFRTSAQPAGGFMPTGRSLALRRSGGPS